MYVNLSLSEVRMGEKTEKLLTKITVITVCAFLFLCVLPVHSEEEIYDRALRLHVIANSDTEIDQEVKLSVRDGVLEYLASYLEGAGTREEARDAVEAQSSEIEKLAEEILNENGFSYGAKLEVCFEDYPRKDYESFAFPAGNYLSVKIKLGEAEGKNWWCVLFPRLCTSVAMSAEEEFIAVGFTPDQYKIITESDRAVYKVRFRFLEFFEEMRNK